MLLIHMYFPLSPPSPSFHHSLGKLILICKSIVMCFENTIQMYFKHQSIFKSVDFNRIFYA